MGKVQEHWGSRIGLVLAMAGNAVGLGNFLRFPVQAIQNGGGAFILPYLVSFLVMGLPLLWVEWAIGRHGGIFGKHSPPFSFARLSPNPFWKYFGVFGIFTNLGIIAYYTYIESWTLAYVFFAIKGTFLGMGQSMDFANFFDYYVDIGAGKKINFPVNALIFFFITLGINIFILSRGLQRGIELVSKIGIPMLLVMGILLAIRALTLEPGSSQVVHDPMIALNFLWEPKFDSLLNPSVWLAAAGQVFFTLSLGMGPVIVYASYIAKNDDIVLNAMGAGWMNEFVEIVVGATIVIPIAVAYMGLDWVQNNAGFMMGFKTLPYLFNNWGVAGSILANFFWFGLLFIAGITSSLSMGTPWMSFMEDEFNWSRKKAAYIFGMVTVILALPTILFFQNGVFDEYDYWTGTVFLVVFAMGEIILFAWVFGMDKAWAEITRGADLKVPVFYKFIIKYVTTFFISIVLLASLVDPVGGRWVDAWNSVFSGNGWPFGGSSIIGRILHSGAKDTSYFVDGAFTHVFFMDMSRLLLVVVFLGIAYMVYLAGKKNRGEGQ